MSNAHLINFNHPSIISKLFQTAVYTFAKDNFPIASYQMKKLQKRNQVNDYLIHRTDTSTRRIDWKALSLSFSTNAIRKSGMTSKFKLCKMLYGKYDDSQYKEEKEVCPMCQEGADTREHLIHCRMTQHLWDVAPGACLLVDSISRLLSLLLLVLLVLVKLISSFYDTKSIIFSKF
jgi:hypothetical protein